MHILQDTYIYIYICVCVINIYIYIHPPRPFMAHGPMAFFLLRLGLEPEELEATFGEHFAHGAELLLLDAEDRPAVAGSHRQ